MQCASEVSWDPADTDGFSEDWLERLLEAVDGREVIRCRETVADEENSQRFRPVAPLRLVHLGLCSADGEWVNGQLLHSDGGLHA